MLITTISELRLASPAHALDSIDGLVGFIDNSEHDFLEDKLGTPLYNALCQWYDENPSVRSSVSDYQTGYWNRLLLLAQRCVAFDALGRAIGMQVISVNNAGINVSVADDYPAPDKNGKTIDLYRDTCTKEAHAALNQLLRQLEQWCKEQPHPQPLSEGEGSDSSDDSVPSGFPDDDTSALSPQTSGIENDERSEIVTLWQKSRYYYLAAKLLTPSCEVLNTYLNIYDSREKFIQLLPDLQFIQEEQIIPSVGDDLMDALIAFSTDGTIPDENLDALFNTVLHRLRKVMAALLAGRTAVLKYTKEQKIQFHDDGVRMFETAINYLRAHQNYFPEDLVKTAPWYVPKSEPAPAPTDDNARPVCCCGTATKDSGNGPALWTFPLL
jgi:hypothetical protein